MSHRFSRGTAWIVAACVSLSLAGCGDSASDEDIARWGDRYCSAADDFVSGFMVSEVQPSGPWEASYEFVQHYRRTRDAAEGAIQTLNALTVPQDARAVHNTTVDVLLSVTDIADDAINDVNHATNRALFQTAIDRYATRLRDEANRLDDATRNASSRVQEHLQSCLP